MTAANITYLGGPGDDERSEPLQWRILEFQVGKAVLVDPDAAESNGERIFFEHVIKKTKNNPHFTVEDAPEGTPTKRRARGRDDEDDGEEPAENDYPEIPANWRELHHTSMIALANKLGAEVSTRDDAANFIAGYLGESV